MAFKIVRNDIVKMNTQAIVNTANDHPAVGTGCDHAVYAAAGHEELLRYRKEKIGFVPEGEVFITPGFALPAEYIIHAVSPLYEGGDKGEEEKLRSCYRKSLELAREHGIKSISFPLISTGGFGYPKEEGMRIALDEIYAFLADHEMEVYLVVFDTKAVILGEKAYPDLESYIDLNYVREKQAEEFGESARRAPARHSDRGEGFFSARRVLSSSPFGQSRTADEELVIEKEGSIPPHRSSVKKEKTVRLTSSVSLPEKYLSPDLDTLAPYEQDFAELKQKLDEKKAHLADSFSEYLLYLIKEHEMTNAEVYKRAIVDKKLFAKIKNDPLYHPQKLTCLCLCVGAKLSLDETKDLLARAGYALSPADMRDVIFSYFIENEIYDMIDLDIQLEEYGIPCVIQ